METYKLIINSNDRVSGTVSNSNFNINLNIIFNGELHVESFTILSNNIGPPFPFLTGVDKVKVLSSFYLQNSYSETIKNITHELITINNTSSVYPTIYKFNNIDENSIGFSLSNENLSNRMLNIKILDQDDNFIDNIGLKWAMVLTFIMKK